MPRSTYPDAAALTTFLEAAGITISTAMRELLDAQIRAARQDFEGAAGCDRLILAGEDAETLTYDPPTGPRSVLFIDDFASVTSVAYQPYGAPAETLTAGQDYWLEPANAAGRGIPVTQIRMRRRWMEPLPPSLLQSLAVTGRRGYSTQVPDDVWTAILARGGARCFPSARYEETGGRLGFGHAHIREDYGQAPGKDVLDAWDAQFQATVAAYRRSSF